MSQNVFNNNPDLLLSDEENIDPVRIHRPKCTSKTFISMASESDSGFSATPSAASPAINSRAATDSPGLPTEVGSASLNPEDSEAGPDINADAFTNEIFRDPSSFDFLSQHGSGNEAALALARQSLYVKFDPLIQGTNSGKLFFLRFVLIFVFFQDVLRSCPRSLMRRKTTIMTSLP